MLQVFSSEHGTLVQKGISSEHVLEVVYNLSLYVYIQSHRSCSTFSSGESRLAAVHWSFRPWEHEKLCCGEETPYCSTENTAYSTLSGPGAGHHWLEKVPVARVPAKDMKNTTTKIPLTNFKPSQATWILMLLFMTFPNGFHLLIQQNEVVHQKTAIKSCYIG